jgi:alpha-tubulin suppressor-like RCC1 family protein
MPRTEKIDLDNLTQITFFGEVPDATLKSPFTLPSLYLISSYQIKKISFGESHCLIQFKNVVDRLGVLGSNFNGQLGQEIETTFFSKVTILEYEIESTSFSFVDVVGGTDYSLALVKFEDEKKYGKFNYIYKFGHSEENRIKRTFVKEHQSLLPNVIQKEDINYQSISLIKNVYSVENKDFFLTEDNSIYLKGLDFNVESYENYHCVLNKFEKNIKSLSFGKNSCLILSTEGLVYVWGSNEYGELGIPGKLIKNPILLDAFKGKKILKAVSGARHSMVLSEEGKVYSFGDNTECQCSGESSNYATPIKVKFPNKVEIIDIDCGMNHSLALSKYGELFSWGDSSQGKLGYSSGGTSQSTPKSIPFLKSKNISLFSAGPMQTAIVTTVYKDSIECNYKTFHV